MAICAHCNKPIRRGQQAKVFATRIYHKHCYQDTIEVYRPGFIWMENWVR